MSLAEYAELMWAAGLFAGEGCATIEKGETKRVRPVYAVLSLGMNDEGSVRRFADALTKYMPPRTYNNLGKEAVPVAQDSRGQWRIHLGGSRAIAAFEVLLPLLKGTDKETQINDVLAMTRDGR